MTSSSQQSPTKPHALVIEDHPATREDVAAVLASYGFAVSACSTAGEAAEDFGSPKLIVLNVTGDDDEPLEFAEWARRRSGNRQPYILALGNPAALRNTPNAAVLCNDVVPWDAPPKVFHERVRAATQWLASRNQNVAPDQKSSVETTSFLEQTGLRRAVLPHAAKDISAVRAPAVAASSNPAVVSSPFKAAGLPATPTVSNIESRPYGREAISATASAGKRKARPAQMLAGGQTITAGAEQEFAADESQGQRTRTELPQSRSGLSEMAPRRTALARPVSPAGPDSGAGIGPVSPPAPRISNETLRMRQLLDHLPMAVALFDRELHYLSVNKRWLDDFNLSETDIIGRSHYEVFPDLHQRWKEVYQRALEGETQYSDEREIEHPNGSRSWVRWEVSPWRSDPGSISGILVSCQSITDQKRGRTGPSAPADNSEDMLDAVEAPAMALDLHGKVTFANASLQKVLGDDTISGRSLWEIASGHQIESLRRSFDAVRSQIATEGELNVGDRFDFALADESEQTKFRLAWAAAPRKDKDGGLIGIVLFGTLRKEAQEVSDSGRIDELESKLATTEASLTDARGLTAIQTNASEEVTNRLRELEEEFSAVDSQRRDAESKISELERKLASAKASVDKLERLANSARESDRLPALVVNALPTGIAVLNSDANAIYSNEGFRSLLGFSIEDAGGVENWLRKACPDESHCDEVVTAWWQRVWQAHTAKVFSLSDASHVLRDIELRPKTLAGDQVLLVATDVTDKRRAEDALRTSDARFRTLFRECGIGVAIVDRNGAILNVNPVLERILGTNLIDLRREKFESLLDPSDVPAKRELEENLRGGDPTEAREIDVCLVHKDGSSVTVTIRAALVRNQAGKELFTAFFIREHIFPTQDPEVEPAATAPDDTSAPVAESARDQAQLAPLATPSAPGPEEAAEGEPMNNTGSLATKIKDALFQSSHRPILIADREGHILDCNSASEEMFGVGIDDLCDAALPDIFDGMDAHAFHSSLIPSLQLTGSFDGEVTVFTNTGTSDCELHLVAINDDNGGLASIIAIFDPIQVNEEPEEVESADDDKTSPAQAETIRECLHQLKNHLQILMSLQNLQQNLKAGATLDKPGLATRNRLSAVAHVYQNVGATENVTTVPFDLVGAALLQSLQRSWAPAASGIEIRWRLDELPLHISHAVPLALIMNELVTNAFEHGFPDGRGGSIHVRLGVKRKRNRAVLIVADSGIMLPDSAGNPGGQGLAIAETLAEQLGGTFRPSPDGKPEFRVVFPLAGTTTTF